MEDPKFCAVYIAPTKALISEVQAKIEGIVTSLGVKPREFGVFVSLNSITSEEAKKLDKKVFVLTQERLQDAMANSPITEVNLLVVDEAHKISDEGRGVVIEDSVQELIEKNPQIQKIVISPYTKNPEKFASVFGITEEVFPEKTSLSPVAQNIIIVKFERKVLDLSLLNTEIDVNDEKKHLQTNESKQLLTSNAKRKAWVVNNVINKGEKTLIYCDRPYDCRVVANNVIKDRGQVPISKDVEDAIQFFSQYVHDEYYLCESLKNGIGYHYGKMPQFVRFQIKQLFENKDLDLLCCTSTLLEGVNLPAKNIVLYDPKAGKALNKLSILNLAGRAGRLMKDYYGKIYCINIDEWENGEDLFDGKLEDIESSVEQTLSKKSNDLIEYLKDSSYISPDGKLAEGVKTLATSLLMKQLRCPNVNFLGDLKKRDNTISDDDIQTIEIHIADICSKITLDKSIILKNRSIDPRFQDELYARLKYGFQALPYPKDDYFYTKILRIFEEISRYIFRNDTTFDRRHEYFALLAQKWILEDSYKNLLDGKIDKKTEYYTRKKIKIPSHDKFINSVIDELDDDIEQVLRYDYTRGLKCYNDIVEEIKLKTLDNRQSCKELPIYLEAGTNNKNTLLLLEAGFSRNLAIDVSHEMNVNFDDIQGTIEWIKANKSNLKDKLFPLLYKELEVIVEKTEIKKKQSQTSV